MKAVRQISTGKLVHGESPDFLPGNGIKNASTFHGLDPADLEEVDVTTEDWKAEHEKPVEPTHEEVLAKVLEVAQEGRQGRKKTLADLKAEIRK